MINLGDDGSLGTWKFSQDAIRKSIAEMIIMDELPFKFVEGRGFRRCMVATCPRFKMPCRWTITRDCFQLFIDEKKKLKKIFAMTNSSVSFTTDTWTSL